MVENNRKTKFKHINNTSEKVLVCLQCFEIIARDDIEHFHKCPYCNFNLELDDEIEDFVLKPVIERWAFRQSSEYWEISSV